MHDWRPIDRVKHIPENQPDKVETSEIDGLGDEYMITFVYTATSFKECKEFIELLAQIFRDRGWMYQVTQKHELCAGCISVIPVSIFSSNCLPYKKADCVILDVDYSKVPFEMYEKLDQLIEIGIKQQIKPDVSIATKSEFMKILKKLKDGGVFDEEITQSVDQTQNQELNTNSDFHDDI